MNTTYPAAGAALFRLAAVCSLAIVIWGCSSAKGPTSARASAQYPMLSAQSPESGRSSDPVSTAHQALGTGHRNQTPPAVAAPLPTENFNHPPQKPHDPAALVFAFDQLEHYYRVPGEFTHRLTGDQYGFETMSFIVTETHPGGGPGLHVHDVEEAHVLLQGRVQYRVGDATFTVDGPYVAKVPAGVPHTFVNAGTAPFNLIAVFASKHPGTKRVGPNPLIGRTASEEPGSKRDP